MSKELYEKFYENIVGADGMVPIDAEETMKWAIENHIALTEREQIVLRKLYIEGLPLRATGNELGLTYTRVGQIRDKAFWKMRHVCCEDQYRVLYGLQMFKDAEEEYKKYREGVIKEIEAVLAKNDKELRILRTKVSNEISSDIPIADLDLSVRSYNVLRHAGIITVRELLTIDFHTILKFRGCGRATLNNIKACCESKGFKLTKWPEDMDRYFAIGEGRWTN